MFGNFDDWTNRSFDGECVCEHEPHEGPCPICQCPEYQQFVESEGNDGMEDI